MLPPAPASLGSPLLMPEFGRYLGAIADTGTTAWDRRRRGRRRWQRKGWLFTAAFTDEWLLAMAIADAGYLGVGFLYFYHRPTGLFLEEKATSPFAFAGDFQPSWRGTWQMGRLGGRGRQWRIEPLGDDWRCRFQGRRLSCDLVVRHRFPGLSALAPAGERPFNYTYKVAGLPVEGSLTVDGKTMTTLDAHGTIDFTVGYPPRRTFWNWASLIGVTEDGRQLGINLVAHFNEGLENALWLNGALTPLAQTQFIPGRDRTRDPWRIDTADDVLEIDFTPEGARRENIRLGLIESRFVQPFGTFRGILREGAKPIPITGYGIVEEHRARW